MTDDHHIEDALGKIHESRSQNKFTPTETGLRNDPDRANDDPAMTEESISTRFGAAARERIQRLLPTIDDDELAWWENELRKAQKQPPPNLQEFIHQFNRFLSLFGYLVKNDRGQLCTVCFNNDRHGVPYLQLREKATNMRKGFKRTNIKLVIDRQHPAHLVTAQQQMTPSL